MNKHGSCQTKTRIVLNNNANIQPLRNEIEVGRSIYLRWYYK